MFNPRICAVIVSDIANPAALSLALLICLPVDNCCIAAVCWRELTVRALCANEAFTLVLMFNILISDLNKCNLIT